MDSGTLSDGLRETLGIFGESGTPRTTPEVAEQLDLGRRTAYARLERLVEEGKLKTKKVGASARVWWRPPAAADATEDWSATTESLVDDVLDDVEVGIFVLDENFQVAWINEATEQYFALDREKVLGRDKRQLIDEHIGPLVEDTDTFTEAVLATYEDNTYTERFECHVTAGENREERWLEHRSKPIEAGAYVGGRVELYYDVTDRKRTELSRQADREEFESLAEDVEEYAIFRLDPEGRVQTWNPGAERIKGYTTDEIVGEHVSAFYTGEDREAGVPAENLAVAARDGSTEDEGWRVRADGSRFWANVTITAIRDDDGDLQGYAKVTRDMTDRRRAEAERELLYETTRSIAEAETFEEGLQAALQDVCEVTDWEYAEAWLPTDRGELRRAEADYYAEGLDEFAAFSEGFTFAPGDGLPGRVYASGEFEWASDLPAGSPEEYPRLDEALDVGLKSSVGVPVVTDGDVVAVLTFVMRESRETDEWLVSLVSSVAAELGNLIARRRAQERLERERELTDRIFETAPIGISVFGPDRELERANERMTDLLGVSADSGEAYAADDLPLFGADDKPLPAEERPVIRVFETGDPVSNEEVKTPRPDGSARWLSVNAIPFIDADEDLIRVVATATDVTQLKEQAERLERRRDELESELDEVFARIDEAFFALDEDWRFTYVNDRAAELVRLPPGELLGALVWDVLPEVAEGYPRAAAERAMEAQEPFETEFYSELLGIWVEIRGYPSETGMSVYVRDVTERKEREQRLEQFERIVETVNDGVYATDGEGRFIFVNDAFVAMSEHTREELLGSHGSAFFGERFVDTDEREWRELISGERDSVEFETDITGPNGETRTVHNQFVALELEDEMGRVGVTRDATERKERERALEEYERIVETVADGIYVLDETREFQRVNDAFTSMTRFDRSELLGAHASLVFGENFGDFDAEASRQFEAGGTDVAVFEEEIYTAEGDAITVESRFTQFDVEDGQGRVGVVRDVTERKRYEERLQALYDSSHELLGADTPAAISEILVETAGGVLDLPGIVVYRYDDDRDLLVPEAESVESDFMREEFPAVPPDDSSLTGHVYASGGPRYYENVIESPYLQISPDETQMRAGLFVPLGEEGVLVAGSRDIDGFDASTRQLVEVLATNATTAYDRVAREQQLVRQRAQLEALNSLNDVAREITGAVIDQSTREEIEQTVCERLADSESYLFAWIGEADPSTETVNLRAEAGVEGYLDGISISVDPDDERSEGPTGRAFRTGEIQVTHDIHADSRHDPWREYIEQYGFRSSAAVPIVHEGTVYGVLNVYAERPYAFEGDERDVISQVGEIVGHAIAAAERKRALMSDELVELEFQIRDVFAALDLPVETSGTITLDHTVPVGDDEFLVYGTATPDAIETVTKLVETVPHWESITVNSEGDPVHFEVRLTSPPVLSVVASLGGYVERAVIEDGDYQMRIHLAPSVDVRRVIDAVEETYPGAELLRRRQITRTQDDQQSLQWRLITDLTDRQRAALEAAYHAGFFEWPRDTSGEEVADSLGVAPPTFHQHLRKAERKVFDAVFSSSVQSVA